MDGKVPHGVETLPKISITSIGCTNITDDRRQTDGRPMTYSEREREFTFAKKYVGYISCYSYRFSDGVCVCVTCSLIRKLIYILTIGDISSVSRINLSLVCIFQWHRYVHSMCN